MKTGTARNLILLEQAGELSARQGRKLHAHLATHPEDRTYRNELLAITAAIREEPRDGTPRATLDRILDAARTPTPPKRELGTIVYLRPALAMAALVALCVVGWVFLTPSHHAPVATREIPDASAVAWDDGIDEQIAELNSMLASVDEAENASDAVLDEWAAELLKLEGSAI